MIHLVAVALALVPALALAFRFGTEGLGANPIEDVTHVSGEWALRLVLISLAITPLRQFFGMKRLTPLRRTLGLAGFGYACVHVSTWAVLDLGLEFGAIFDDLTERPYIMAGMSAFALLLVLAVTSTRASMRRLGGRWTKLHRLVYAAALLGVLHHFWLIKADYRPAIVHATLLAALLGARVAWRFRERRELEP